MASSPVRCQCYWQTVDRTVARVIRIDTRMLFMEHCPIHRDESQGREHSLQAVYARGAPHE